MSDSDLRDEVLLLRHEIGRLRKSLSELAPSLPVLLRRRGFRIYKKEPRDDLLVPEERFIEDYYRLLQKYSFRLFLRDVIKHQEQFTVRDVTRYATQGVTAEYVEYLSRSGLIGTSGGERTYQLKDRPIKSFGPTLEWFLAEIFRREFGAEAIWGVKFKRSVIGGDYDLIAKIDGAILCMEVKSSPPKQIYAKELAAFLGRIFDLRPEIAVFFMDTELRMKDKIVPMFEEELARRPLAEITRFFGSADKPPAVLRIEKELFHAGGKIIIINAKDSIVRNIEKVLSFHFRKAL
jgi:Holliday junction resolvase